MLDAATCATGAEAAGTIIPAPEPTTAAPAAASVARVPATGIEARPASGATETIACERGLDTAWASV